MANEYTEYTATERVEGLRQLIKQQEANLMVADLNERMARLNASSHSSPASKKGAAAEADKQALTAEAIRNNLRVMRQDLAAAIAEEQAERDAAETEDGDEQVPGVTPSAELVKAARPSANGSRRELAAVE